MRFPVMNKRLPEVRATGKQRANNDLRERHGPKNFIAR
jgi:hypothetical protein